MNYTLFTFHFIAATFLIIALFTKEKRKIVLLGLFGLFLSGFGIIYQMGSLEGRHWPHIIFALLFTLSFYTKKMRRKALFFLYTLLLMSGHVTTLGINYFTGHQERFLLSKLESNPHVIKNEAYIDFKREVLPVLRKKCFSCHYETNHNLFGYPKILTHLNGLSPSSPLWRRITLSPTHPQHMPLGKGYLLKEEAQVLKEWMIAGGLSVEAAYQTREKTPASDHWFLKKPLNKEGHFNLSESLAALYSNTKEIPPHRLQRKLFLSLLGRLPLTTEQDLRSKSYKKVVTTLLRRDDFNVNMMLFLQDYFRMSDSPELEEDDVLPNHKEIKDKIYHLLKKNSSLETIFRDILKTPNKNQVSLYRHTPRFVKDEIYAASLALNNLYQGTLGITVDCARCHDHKYAPISNETYYGHLSLYNEVYDFYDFKNYRLRVAKGHLPKKEFIEVFQNTTGQFETSLEGFRNLYTDPDNGIGYFTYRHFVNSLWVHLTGKGFYSPKEDPLLSKEAPPHFSILEHLTLEFIKRKTDLRWLVKEIVQSPAFTKTGDNLPLRAPMEMSSLQIRDSLLSIRSHREGPSSTFTKSAYLPRKQNYATIDFFPLQENIIKENLTLQSFSKDTIENLLSRPETDTEKKMRMNFTKTFPAGDWVRLILSSNEFLQYDQ